jgi:hypothetical protein
MTIKVLVHVSGEDPILGELSELPPHNSMVVTINNPRRRDGKDLRYLQSDVATVVWPMRAVNFIQVLPSVDEEKLIGPVRE